MNVQLINRMYLFALIAMVLSVYHVSSAADLDWTGGGDNTTFTDAANWGGTTPATGDDFSFWLNAPTTVNVDTPFEVGSLRVNYAYVISGNDLSLNPTGRWGSYDIYLNNGAEVQNNINLLGNAIFYTASQSDTARPTLSGTISESGGVRALTLSTGGNVNFDMVLSGNNSYTGGTTVNNITLELGHNNSFGTGGVTINGGNLQVSADRVIANAVEFNDLVYFGRYGDHDGTMRFTGDLSIGSAGTNLYEADSDPTKRVELAGTLNDNGNGFILTTTQKSEFKIESANAISGDVTWVLNGSTRYGDASPGTIAVANDQAFGDATITLTPGTSGWNKVGVLVAEDNAVTLANDIVLDAEDTTVLEMGAAGTRITLTGQISTPGLFGSIELKQNATLATRGTIGADLIVGTAGGGARLAHTGDIIGNVTVSGNDTLGPGLNTSGELDINGNLQMQTDSIYEYDGGDLVNISGDADFSNWTLNLDGTDLVLDGSSSILLFTYGTGAIGDPSQVNYSNFSTTPTGLTYTDDGSAFYVNGLAVIPESSSYVLMIIGMTALFFLRKTTFGRK
ncbi:MAG: hypothetical protein WD708_11315 [Kiritimatiellia bacterium]